MERHSEVGKVEMGPYIRGEDDSCPKKVIHLPLTRLPVLKIRRDGPPGKPRLRRASLWILWVYI